jgi:hypothetical protein
MPDLKKIHTLKDILVVPRYRQDLGKNSADVSYTFPYSGRQFDGVPLILGGTWSLADAYKVAETGILAQFHHAVPSDINEFFSNEANKPSVLSRMVYHAQPGDDLEAVFSGEHPLYLRVRTDFENLLSMRNAFPKVTIIAGDFISRRDAVGMAQLADLVVVGSLDYHHMEEMWGVAVDAVDIIQETQHGVVASLCSTLGDVVKCLAIGADFVEIGPALSQYSIEQIIATVASACEALGAEGPYALPFTTELATR